MNNYQNSQNCNYAYICSAAEDFCQVGVIVNQFIQNGYIIHQCDPRFDCTDEAQIMSEIEGCTIFVWFISENSASSKKNEVLNAIGAQKPILQVRMDSTRLPRDVAYHLPSTMQYISIDSDPSEFYRKLFEALSCCRPGVPRMSLSPQHFENNDGLGAQHGGKPPKKSARVGIITILMLLLAVGAAFYAFILPKISNGDHSESVILEETTESVDLADGYYSPDKIYEVGDSFLLGTYEQDGKRSNGGEYISWTVFSKEGSRALAVTDYCIEAYKDTGGGEKWVENPLRSWLNKEFYDYAFTDSDKQYIQTVTITNDNNEMPLQTPVDGGPDTIDSVFCLGFRDITDVYGEDILMSAEENNAFKCQPTTYAAKNGIPVDVDNHCTWILRTPGILFKYATVLYDGSIDPWGNIDPGETIGTMIYGVRPAIYIDAGEDE